MSNKIVIIAEAGINHNGDIKIAKKLIRLAAKSGADIIKFQTYISKDLVTTKARLTPYQQKKNKQKKQISLLKKNQLSFNQFKVLKQYSKKYNIDFLSSAFDFKSAEFINSLNLKYFKIPSGEITNYPLLKKISQFNKNIIVSTGMSNLQEIRDALKIIRNKNKYKKNIILLHCTSSYPTSYKDVNLNTMLSLKKIFKNYNIQIGLSDHSLGSEAAIAATAFGAKFIEKHFTLDKKLRGPDHKASLNPKEFSDFVKSIRNTEKLLGSKIKKITKSEIENINLVRKSIVASKKIIKGHLFTEFNITLKRPANGLHPKFWEKLIGTKAKKNYKIDDFI